MRYHGLRTWPCRVTIGHMLHTKLGEKTKENKNEYLKKLIRIICMVSGVMENLHDLPYVLGSDQLLLFHLLSKNKSSM